jgi:hypothetical protein
MKKETDGKSTIVVFILCLFLSALLRLESKLIVAACMDASVIRGIFRVSVIFFIYGLGEHSQHVVTSLDFTYGCIWFYDFNLIYCTVYYACFPRQILLDFNLDIDKLLPTVQRRAARYFLFMFLRKKTKSKHSPLPLPHFLPNFIIKFSRGKLCLLSSFPKMWWANFWYKLSNGKDYGNKMKHFFMSRLFLLLLKRWEC